MGLLKKANTLYKQERFSEAFKIIAKAVDKIKDELEEKEKQNQNEKIQWKLKLGLTARNFIIFLSTQRTKT